MKIHYTGRQVELAPAELKKIEAGFAKVGKLLDGKDEKEAHVILSSERHLHYAEVTVHYHNHHLVGIGSSPDLFTAIDAAVEKLEKQAIKVRTRWRDARRVSRKAETGDGAAEAEEPEAGEEGAEERRIFRVDYHKKSKPMTLDEALLEMEKGRDYLVYRDAGNDRIHMLVRRRDGNFDLIQT